MAVVVTSADHGLHLCHATHIMRTYPAWRPIRGAFYCPRPYMGKGDKVVEVDKAIVDVGKVDKVTDKTENVADEAGAETVAKRVRKRRKVELNSGQIAQEERHGQLRDLLLTGTMELVKGQLREARYTDCEATGDDSLRTTAELSFVELGELARLGWSGAEAEDKIVLGADDNTAVLELEHVFGRVVQNISDKIVQLSLLDHQFLLPPKSQFIMSSFGEFEPLRAARPVGGFDAIVLDPPWENKSVKRASKYRVLPHTQLVHLPIRNLISNHGLVLVWVTNKVKIIDFVSKVLFPRWKLRLVATWYWVKVTSAGELVIDFDSLHRKPYETVLIGRRTFDQDDITITNAQHSQKEVEPNRVFTSVPCRQHSRKPPLDEVLQPYLPPNPSCLELFARNLIPHWTSWGNEAIRFQDTMFFEQTV